MTRRLALRSEHLSELSPADLSSVNGAALPTYPLDGCFAITTGTCDRLSLDCLTGYYPSLNAPCTTI
ncbi:MAG TPA: hypothetical protein VF519_04980 [Mycobacteriales bacterium]|jgi:hypothetical protein